MLLPGGEESPQTHEFKLPRTETNYNQETNRPSKLFSLRYLVRAMKTNYTDRNKLGKYAV